MKRTSILATMVVTGLLGIAALGASSASADILCNKVFSSGTCPTGNVFPVGTKFHAAQQSAIVLKSAAGKTLFACGLSAMDLTVTNAGGGELKYPKMDVTNLTFGGCGDDPTFGVSGGSAVIDRVPGTFKGGFNWSGEQIETRTNVYGPGTETRCIYSIEGPGTIVGPEQSEKSGTTQLVFKDTPAQVVGGAQWYLCTKATFSATYDINYPEKELYPNGIYALLK